MKVCPPGMICFESMSMGLIFVIVLFAFLIFHQQRQINEIRNSEMEIYKSDSNMNNSNTTSILGYEAPSLSLMSYFNNPSNMSACNDTLFNAYAGPFKSDSIRVRPPCGGGIGGVGGPPNLDIRGTFPVGGVPINVKTQGGDSDFRQIGILTSNRNDNMILPLLGRPMIQHRDTWQYYALSERNIKLPVMIHGKNCTNEYGCTSINDQDIVQVQGMKDNFTVTLYENNTMTYIPYL